MLKAQKILDTLERHNEKDLVLALRLFSFYQGDEFKLPEFYQKIYNDIHYILERFRDYPHYLKYKMKGLTVDQIGFVMNRMNEPWPNVIIAMTIQYKILGEQNKLVPINDILKMKFWNLENNENIFSV